jgi:hypothetical protein
MPELEQQYRIVAGGDYEAILRLLTLAQDHAADVRSSFNGNAPSNEQRLGGVAILGEMIDRIKSARKTLTQQPNRTPNREDE